MKNLLFLFSFLIATSAFAQTQSVLSNLDIFGATKVRDSLVADSGIHSSTIVATNKYTTSVKLDTLDSDTLYNLPISTHQSAILRLDTNALLLNFDSTALTLGQSFDFRLTVISDTARAVQLAYFTSGKFYTVEGETSLPLTEEKENSTGLRRDVLSFFYDGYSPRKLSVITISDFR